MRREVHSNYRLVVTLSIYLRNKHAIAQAFLDEMATAIGRHVDHVGEVTVEWDTRAECSHCGQEWETVTAAEVAAQPDVYAGFVAGEPVCCSEASAEFRAQRETGGA